MRTGDNEVSTLASESLSIMNAAHDVKFGVERLVIDQDTDYQYILAYKDIATKSDVSTSVSTAISGQTKETWTFTLADGSTVTKSVVLG